MVVKSGTIDIDTRGNCDVINVTDEVAAFVSESGLTNGIAHIFVPGATGGVTTIEYEDGLVRDLRDVMEKLAPERASYAHNARWGDGNGHSHIRASLLGSSISVPVVEGRLVLGTWQQIIVVDFDVRPRLRGVVVQAIGE